MIKITSIYTCIYTSIFTHFLNFSMNYIDCCVCSSRLLVMDRDTVRNIQSPIPKNEFEKLVFLVGFIIRIYHDARSLECQIQLNVVGSHELLISFQPLKCHAFYAFP